jgi:hypothetical protein
MAETSSQNPTYEVREALAQHPLKSIRRACLAMLPTDPTLTSQAVPAKEVNNVIAEGWVYKVGSQQTAWQSRDLCTD